MGKKTYPFFAYLSYWLKKEDQYSLQSSFIFELYTGICDFLKAHPNGFPEFELFRKDLLQNQNTIQVEDFGAGSKKVPGRVRQINRIAKYSTSSSKYASLYHYLCLQTPAIAVIELGTCLGISTRYLSKATKGTVYTLEGSSQLLTIAKRDFPYPNTEFIPGKIKDNLLPVLERINQVDFALIDAHHTFEGTIWAWEQLKGKIHHNSIIVIGDIHWSAEMEAAWKKIKTDPMVNLSFDFYECGVLFFNYPGPKTNLILDL